jgi:hypothetical protein
MWRACMTIFIALSLVLIQAPFAKGEEPGAADPPSDGAKTETARPETVQTPSQNSSQPATAPADKRIEKIRRTVRKIGIGSKITAYLNNGDELHGTVSMVDTESFQVAEVDLHQLFTLQYKNVKKIREGFDGINVFTGKRVSHPRGLKIGVLVGALFLVLGLPIIALATAKD